MKKAELKNRVKGFRALQGDLTQQQLADKVGCSRQTIISIETSKFVPSVELALKLAVALNVKIEDIFSLEEDEKP
ncbi:MAG: helix-turn-helix transcriptional regulator [Bdellovibrionaceae bacterium]|nr:helix-turn-helix transcriptional regulator [Pseudobdellovibrionaceae bacterium]